MPHRSEGYAWTAGKLRHGDHVSPTKPYAAGALLTFFFADRIKEGTYRIGSDGAIRSFVLMEESTSDKGRIRSYLAALNGIGMRCTFTLAPDGKIAGIGLRLQ